MQSPLARKIESSHLGISPGFGAGAAGGNGRGAVSASFVGLTSQYTTSCPAGPAIRNAVPAVAGTW
jgi:hypothetical protein